MNASICDHPRGLIGLALAGMLAGTLLSSCQQPESRVADAKTNVVEAKQELSDAESNAANERNKEWQPFKMTSEDRIRHNETALDNFKAKLSAGSTAFRERYQERADELVRRNNHLKDKIADYKDEGADALKDFQQDLRRDMDGLDTAIKDLPAGQE